MSFRWVTTTLSSLRTTACDALIVPSATAIRLTACCRSRSRPGFESNAWSNSLHDISITSVNKSIDTCTHKRTFNFYLYYVTLFKHLEWPCSSMILITNTTLAKTKVYQLLDTSKAYPFFKKHNYTCTCVYIVKNKCTLSICLQNIMITFNKPSSS